MKISKYTQCSPGVWTAQEEIASITQGDLLKLAKEATDQPLKRSRLCVHPSESDLLQDMFIAFAGDSYVRPSAHVNRDESIHFIKGCGKYVFFDDDGHRVRDVRMGTYASDLAFYLRVPGNSIHALLPLSSEVIAHEVAQGPYDRATTLFPGWSVDGEDRVAVESFTGLLAYAPVSTLEPVSIERVAEDVYRCCNSVVYLTRTDVERLKCEVPLTRNGRLSLQLHPAGAPQLNETLQLHSGMSYIQPSMRATYDESFCVLEGEADCVFFDERGTVIDVIQLSAINSESSLFVRVPRGVFHTLLVRSELLVMLSATGPDEAVYASWSPSASDRAAALAFTAELEKRLGVR